MVWSAMASDLAARGCWKMALQIVWMVVTYHRPGKAPLTVRRKDLVRPTRGGSSDWGVIPYPDTRPVTRNTGAQDQAISLTNRIYPWLPRLMPNVAGGDGDSLIFDHSYSSFL